MPIYEYRCSKCGKEFEIIQKLNEGGMALECSHCGAADIKKVLSNFSSSKGSGSTSLCRPGSSPKRFT